MTARSSIERLADDTPVPHPDSWPARRPPSPATAALHTALEAQAIKSAAWLATQHRDGIIPPADMIVLDCLRALQAIPENERAGADELMDVIAKGYLDTAWGAKTSRRRLTALLRIAGGREA
jgi:hypothetical protein